MADFTSRFNELLTRHPGNDTQLGAALGVSKQTISAWRVGTRSPKKPHIVAIAKYFDVSIPWLMGISDYESEWDEIRHSLGSDSPAAQRLREIGNQIGGISSRSDADEAEILAIYRDLNNLGRQTLLGTARGLAANPDMRKDGPSKSGTA